MSKYVFGAFSALLFFILFSETGQMFFQAVTELPPVVVTGICLGIIACMVISTIYDIHMIQRVKRAPWLLSEVLAATFLVWICLLLSTENGKTVMTIGASVGDVSHPFFGCLNQMLFWSVPIAGTFASLSLASTASTVPQTKSTAARKA